MKSNIILTDYAYELLGMTRPIIHEKLTVIGKGVYESYRSATDPLDKNQTAYHDIPEYLIQEQNHANYRD